MMTTLHLVLGVAVVVCVTAVPAPESPQIYPLARDNDQPDRTLLEGDLYEGDIQLPFTRNGAINPAQRWPGAVIPYAIDTDVSAADRNIIAQAIADYNRFTCVRWIPRSSQLAYVQFRRQNTGCWSYVGRIGGRQELNLQSPGCNYKGIAIHEMMHAAGFWHEQSRPDRDVYVRVNWQNIISGRENNFNKLSPAVATTFGVGYDYGSIMHYSATAFTRNGQPTLTPLQPLNGRVMGQINGFSFSDYQRINRMYNCVRYPR